MARESLLAADAGQFTYIHSSHVTVKGLHSVLALLRTDTAVGLTRCPRAHTLTQNEGACVEVETREDISTHGSKSGTGYVDSLSLGKQVSYFRSKAPSSTVGDACLRLPSPTIGILSW